MSYNWGSNDPGPNDIGSTNLGSNDIGSNEKRSKTLKNVKRQKDKMEKIFFVLFQGYVKGSVSKKRKGV